MRFRDEKWLRAAEFVFANRSQFLNVFTAKEVAQVTPIGLPIPFAHLYANELHGLVVIPKDDVDLLPLNWVRNIHRARLLYADEVFAALDFDRLDSVSETDTGRKHLGYLLKRAEHVLSGRRVRKDKVDSELSNRSNDEEPYVLIVLAVLTGNVGERVMGEACARLLRNAFPDLKCVVASSNVDRQLVAGASIVVVGPGGMLYDDLGRTTTELQNLANYFKFGFLAKEYGKPFFVIGIGHQNVASSIGWRFLAGSLEDARFITTRDRETATLLSARANCPIQTAPDLSVLFAERIKAVASILTGQRTLALCGDYRRDSDLPSVIAALREDFEFQLKYVVQAEEDAAGLSVHEASLRDTFGDAFVVEDRRWSTPDDFIHSIASADALITTRFHATKVALMAGISSVVFYTDGDKRHRLMREVGNLGWISLKESCRLRFSAYRNDLANLVRLGERRVERAVVFGTERFDPIARTLSALATTPE